jgi:chromosome segregation ATPase
MQDSLDLKGAASIEDSSPMAELRTRLEESTSEKIRVMSQILELRVETEALLKSLRGRLDVVNRELESCRRGHQMHAHQLETRIGELEAQLSASEARSAEMQSAIEGLGPKINGLQEASSRLDELCSRIGSYRSVDS